MEAVENSAVMDVGALAHAHTEFMLNLHKAVAKEAGPHKNAVLSPLSVSLALAMAAAGAKGPTLEQMASCIKLPAGDLMHKFSAHLKDVITVDASKQGLELSCANRLWVDKSIQLKPTFQNLLKDTYGSGAASVDFLTKAEEAREKVNTWAKDETHGKIANCLPPGSVGSDTRLILANAIYFKGMWESPFDEADTQEGDFYLPDGNTIKVPMMQSGKNQYVRSYPTFKALRLRYVLKDDTRRFSMYVLLPHEKNGLVELEENLNTKAVIDDLHVGRKVPVSALKLPKVKMSFGTEMSETLKALGMDLAFGSDADLSNITDTQEPLGISSVCHKAFVEVNEQGTEAAAVTTVSMVRMCLIMSDEDIEFIADHPFLFIIKEESTNTIIFTGRVNNPSKEG